MMSLMIKGEMHFDSCRRRPSLVSRGGCLVAEMSPMATKNVNMTQLDNNYNV